MDRGAWRATIQDVAKGLDTTEPLTLSHLFSFVMESSVENPLSDSRASSETARVKYTRQ